MRVHQEHSPENPHGLQGGIYHLRQQLPKTGHLDICTQTMCRTTEAHLSCWAVTSAEGTFASPLKSQSIEDKPCSPRYLGSGRLIPCGLRLQGLALGAVVSIPR